MTYPGQVEDLKEIIRIQRESIRFKDEVIQDYQRIIADLRALLPGNVLPDNPIRLN